MDQLLNSLQLQIKAREILGQKRTLTVYPDAVDFCSNDYFGFAKDPVLHKRVLQYFSENPNLLFGTTGSRLVSGNSDFIMQTERYLASEHQVESALLFPSGYTANVALLSALLKKGDTVIVDEKIHRSVHDGCQLSFAKKWKFKHNDIAHLEHLLQKVSGRCFIAVESLYSMDGDFAPLQQIAILADQYGAGLVVDEAHAFGVFGYGLVKQARMQSRVLATVVTYVKALGTHGAAILSSETLKDYLINYATPFIYSTALPNMQVAGVRIAYEYLKSKASLSYELQDNLTCFRSNCSYSRSHPQSPIQMVGFKDSLTLYTVQQVLQQQGIRTFAVVPPTVASGDESLRICLHVFNTKSEIKKLCEIINQYA